MIMDKISILTYLADNSVLVIPKYQREYCWKKENCYELFEDLKTIISIELITWEQLLAVRMVM